MNQVLCHPKIKPEHLARRAIVYLRQSSEKQVRQKVLVQTLGKRKLARKIADL